MSLVLLLAIATVAKLHSDRLLSTSKWHSHTHEVLAALDSVLSGVSEAEAAQRRYLLTSDEHHLEPYNTAVADVKPVVQQLEDLTADHPEQQRQISVLQTLVKELFSGLQEAIDLHRLGRVEQAKTLVNADRDARTTAEIRALAKGIRFEESQQLKSRRLEANQAARSYIWAVYGSTGLAFLLAALAVTKMGALIGLASKREQRLSELIEALPNAVVLVTKTGTIEFVNEAALALFRYSREEIIGEQVEILIPKSIRQAHVGMRDEFFRHPTSRRMGERRDLNGVRKDGSLVPIEVGLTYFETEAGPQVLACISDITERREREVELAESHAALNASQTKLRGVIDHSSNFIGVLSLDGALLDANRTSLDGAGVKFSEVAGKPFWDTPWWTHSEELQKRLKLATKKAAAGTADGFDATHPTPDGNALDIAFSLKPVFDDNGDVSYLIPEGRDVTMQNRREEELSRLNQELARSNQELEQFASVASHDLQEPLRKISSYGELLKESCESELGSEGKRYLGVICNGAERLKQLVGDLLQFSRINTQNKELTEIETSACLRAALDSLELVIRENDATVTHDVMPRAIANRSYLTLLFQNLVGNALKYRGESTPEIHVGVRRLGSQFEFSVRDNGIGIESQYFDRVFEIFKRLHGKSEYSGTGIGLALCKRIVDKFGGEIWLESSPGIGSTFYFTLNCAVASSPNLLSTGDESPVLKGVQNA